MARPPLRFVLLAVVLVAVAGCAGTPGSTPATTETTETTASDGTPSAPPSTTTAPSTTTPGYGMAIEDDLSIENERNVTATVTVRVFGPDDGTVFDRTVTVPPGDRRVFNLSFPDRDYRHGDPKYRFVASDGEHTASRSLGAPADYLVEVDVRPDGLEIHVLAI